MPRNDAAAPGHVCPGIRIHAIDIVQPPGIGMSSMPDIDAHQTIVPAALAAKSSAETPRKARSEARSETMRCDILSWREGQGSGAGDDDRKVDGGFQQTDSLCVKSDSSGDAGPARREPRRRWRTRRRGSLSS